MVCCICSQEIEKDANGWAGGHNAQPVAEGRCCDACNSTVVIPTRLEEMVNYRARTTGS